MPPLTAPAPVRAAAPAKAGPAKSAPKSKPKNVEAVGKTRADARRAGKGKAKGKAINQGNASRGTAALIIAAAVAVVVLGIGAVLLFGGGDGDELPDEIVAAVDEGEDAPKPAAPKPAAPKPAAPKPVAVEGDQVVRPPEDKSTDGRPPEDRPAENRPAVEDEPAVDDKPATQDEPAVEDGAANESASGELDFSKVVRSKDPSPGLATRIEKLRELYQLKQDKKVFEGLQAMPREFRQEPTFLVFSLEFQVRKTGGCDAGLAKHLADVDPKGHLGQLGKALVLFTADLKARSRDQAPKALKIMNKMTELYPESAFHHFLRARICSFLKFGDEARRSYQKALEIDPRDHDSLLQLVGGAVRSKRFSRAKELCNQAISRDATYYHYYLLAYIAEKQLDWDSAIKSADRSIKEYDQWGDAYRIRGQARISFKAKGGMADLDKAFELGVAKAYLFKAYMLDAQGDKAGARVALDAINKRYPRYRSKVEAFRRAKRL